MEEETPGFGSIRHYIRHLNPINCRTVHHERLRMGLQASCQGSRPYKWVLLKHTQGAKCLVDLALETACLF